MNAKKVIGQRITKVHQGWVNAGRGWGRQYVVHAIELENGLILSPFPLPGEPDNFATVLVSKRPKSEATKVAEFMEEFGVREAT